MIPFTPELVGLSEEEIQSIGLFTITSNSVDVYPKMKTTFQNGKFVRTPTGEFYSMDRDGRPPLTQKHLAGPAILAAADPSLTKYDALGNETEITIVQAADPKKQGSVAKHLIYTVRRGDFEIEICSIIIHFIKEGDVLVNNSFVNLEPYTETGFKSLPYSGRTLAPLWKLELYNEGPVGANPLKGEQNYNPDDFVWLIDGSTPEEISIPGGNLSQISDDGTVVAYDNSKGAVLRIQMYDWQGNKITNPRMKTDSKGAMWECWIDLHTGERLR